MGLAGSRRPPVWLALVSLASSLGRLENGCLLAPQDGMQRDVGARATDGTGCFVTVEQRIRRGWWLSDSGRRPGGCACAYDTGWLWPLRMAKRAKEGATRGGERRNNAAYGYGVSLGAFTIALGAAAAAARTAHGDCTRPCSKNTAHRRLCAIRLAVQLVRGTAPKRREDVHSKQHDVEVQGAVKAARAIARGETSPTGLSRCTNLETSSKTTNGAAQSQIQ